MFPHVQRAVDAYRDTADWLLTEQAAVMAQADEQTRGQHNGLVVGDDNPAPLHEWINATYGDLPYNDQLQSLPPAAQEAGRVRQWQAQRLRATAPVVVHGDCADAAFALATSGMFHSTPQLPKPLEHGATFSWGTARAQAATTPVVTPGMLPGEDKCCAITINAGEGRIMEWSPAPAVETLGSTLTDMLSRAGGSLPTWLLSSDVPYSSEPVDTLLARKMVTQAASERMGSYSPTMMEVARAVMFALLSGLFDLRRYTDDSAPIFEVVAPEK